MFETVMQKFKWSKLRKMSILIEGSGLRTEFAHSVQRQNLRKDVESKSKM